MPNIELLEADIRDQLVKIARLEKDFVAAEVLMNRSADEVGFYDRAAIGYYMHSFYNGCENIFRSIASFFENELEPDSWHSDLLRRMKLEIPGYRPAVINDELYLLLEDFRGFRHVFRHSYTFELDWDRERLVVSKFRHSASLMHKQVQAFLAQLEEFEERQ
ncbi:MAG: hypothetical protein WD273_04135 [Trueperaceae bacterium]